MKVDVLVRPSVLTVCFSIKSNESSIDMYRRAIFVETSGIGMPTKPWKALIQMDLIGRFLKRSYRRNSADPTTNNGDFCVGHQSALIKLRYFTHLSAKKIPLCPCESESETPYQDTWFAGGNIQFGRDDALFFESRTGTHVIEVTYDEPPITRIVRGPDREVSDGVHQYARQPSMCVSRQHDFVKQA